MQISEKYKRLPVTSIVEIHEIKSKMNDVISFDRGDINLKTPDHVRDSVKKAIEEDFTNYMPVSGIDDFKSAVKEKLRRKNNINASEEEILATTGGTGGLFVSLQACLNEGDEILILDPHWPSYPMLIKLAGAKPVPVPFGEKFTVDFEEIKKRITKKTSGMIINTPHNPSGSVMWETELQMISKIAIDNDLWVFSDEAYEDLLHEGEHISIGSLDDMKERTISIFSLSKTYSMPGMRAGYIVGPEDLIDQAYKAAMYSTAHVNSITNKAAVAALNGSHYFLNDVKEIYRERKELLFDALKDINIFELKEPKGTFYLFPKLKIDMGSEEFCKRLLKEKGVATIPGSAFGEFSENRVRFSYSCVNKEEIKEGIERINKFLDSFL